MAAVPFAARALVGTIPDAVMKNAATAPVTLKEMIEDFLRQLPECSTMIENIMQSGASTFVLHCREGRHAEVLLHSGLTFRSHHVKLVPAPNTQWVKLTRVVYGTTENAIKSRLSDYGKVLKIRRELVHGIGISVYSVKMEVGKPIPSRIVIANYPVNVFYRGQVQQCFRCEQTGHLSKDCPFKRSGGAPAARIVGEQVVIPPVGGVPPVGGAPSSVVPPAVGDPPATNVPVVDPAGTNVPVGDLPVVDDRPPTDTLPDPPVMDVSPSENPSLHSSVEGSSTSTPVNPDTGKRQVSDPQLSPPSKKEKTEESTYEDFEREILRCRVLGSNLTPDDRQAMSDVEKRIPAHLKPTYKKTFSFRHPTWGGEVLPSAQMFTDLGALRWPEYCVDLSSSPLYSPALPADMETPAISYFRYDIIRTYMEARHKFKHLPSPSLEAQKDIDSLSKNALQVFNVFYASSHPENMKSVAQTSQKIILDAIINRDDITYDEDDSSDDSQVQDT
jgi:hypothetical protein